MGYCNWGLPFGHGGWLFGHGPFGLLHILLAAVLVYVLFRLGRAFLARGGTNRDASDSLEILRTRFARGEISAEEFQRLREILRQ